MKQFKIIDFWGGLVLVLVALLCVPFFPVYAFFIGYFIIGGWHIISMLVHFFNKRFTHKKNARSNYHWTVVVIIALALAGILVKKILWFMAIVMLFVAPIMIFIYANICYKEIQTFKRPLDQLK